MMPSLSTWMHVMLLAVGLTLLIAEGIALVNKATGDTVSEVVREWNIWSGGLVALLLAALWWHWFGWMPRSWR